MEAEVITPELKHDIFAATGGLFRAAKFAERGRGACMLWTGCLIKAAATRGVELIPNAGTVVWPVNATAGLRFLWDEPKARDEFARGVFPSMHVWASRSGSGEVIDASVVDLPEDALHFRKERYRFPRPLPLWSPPDQMPNGWRYSPDVSASGLAELLLDQQVFPVLKSLAR